MPHPRIYSVEEANRVLPKLIAVTEATLKERARSQTYWTLAASHLDEYNARIGQAEEEEMIEAAWAQQVALDFGVLPKGFLTVDFATDDPEVFLCWTYGEPRVSYQHMAWESFSHRRPLEDVPDELDEE
jgi:hypothetical protein